MDKISEFLNKTQEEYKFELLSVEHNIERLRSRIDSDSRAVFEIEASIDKSYDVVSAFGSANDDKRVEIAALRELIDSHNTELEEQTDRKIKYEKSIVDIGNMITFYDSQMKTIASIDIDEIISKLDFISKLVNVDAFRAVEEIEQLKIKLAER